jgi:mevalonate kinase
MEQNSIQQTTFVEPLAASGGKGLSVPLRGHAQASSACGKAIIVGEHAVVYGARAVAMPVLTMQVGVKIKRHFNPGQKARMFLAGKEVSEHLLGVVEDTAKILGVPVPNADFEGRSSVLIGAGLGSSAAICVVVLKALAAYNGIDLSPRQIAYFGNQLEKRFHGNPSGLDTSVVAYEQAISFRKGETPIPLHVARIQLSQQRPVAWRFVLLDSGQRSSTLEMIKQAAPWFSGDHSTQRIERFDQLALEVIQGLSKGQSDLVGSAMNEAGALLDEAGVINQKLSDLTEIAKKAGAIGVKATGAGGGGCVLALLPPSKSQLCLNTLTKTLGLNRIYEVELS